MNASTHLSCAILAGGRSRRMGQDKALLTLPDGRTLLGKTVNVARSLTPNLLIVTPWAERYERAIALDNPPNIQWIEDRLEAGPLAGFSQAWPQIHTDWCLLLACDLPNLDAPILQQWWDWLSQGQDLEASLIERQDRWEPLCGYYHRSCLRGLTQHLASGERDFQSWLPTLNIAPYPAVPANMLFNCNTPSDWDKVQLETDG